MRFRRRRFHRRGRFSFHHRRRRFRRRLRIGFRM